MENFINVRKREKVGGKTMKMKVLVDAEEEVAEPLCVVEGAGAWCCIIW